ncbi:MAG: PQQ-binding-like beta-propeller repeat protein [bacterium]
MTKTMSTIFPIGFRRWLIPVSILVLSISAYFYIWIGDSANRQDQVISTMVLGLLALLALVIWFAFSSSFQKRFRMSILGGFIFFALLSSLAFRIRGFSGDVLPMIEWRWSNSIASSKYDLSNIFLPHADMAQARNNYAQFLGLNRNGTVQGIHLNRDWASMPPREIWRQPIGAGWSAFAILGSSAITQEQTGDEEMVVSYDVLSGKVKWRHSDKTRYDTALTGAGPHATPTIANNRVFTLGATGTLNCLDLTTGRKIWSKNILEDNGAKINTYGISNSPLVLDSLVIVSAGGANGNSLVAYHAKTGARVWNAGGVSHSAYSSPFLTTFSGHTQIILFNKSQITAHDPQFGHVLWKESWPKETQAISQPVPLPGDRLFVSSGYGIGGKLFQIRYNRDQKFEITQIWRSPRLKAKLSNVVYKDGFLYGLDDGVFVCLDSKTGRRKWKKGRYGHGQIILVEDLILVQSEQGDVILLEANTEKHIELGRIAALNSKTWNHPALAAPYLLVRNDKEAVCFELPIASK